MNTSVRSGRIFPRNEDVSVYSLNAIRLVSRAHEEENIQRSSPFPGRPILIVELDQAVDVHSVASAKSCVPCISLRCRCELNQPSST